MGVESAHVIHNSKIYARVNVCGAEVHILITLQAGATPVSDKVNVKRAKAAIIEVRLKCIPKLHMKA